MHTPLTLTAGLVIICSLVWPTSASCSDVEGGEIGRVRLKPGQGLQVTSDNGEVSLTLGLRAQFLYSLVGGSGGEGVTRQGGEIRRARVTFSGHTFGRESRFKLEVAISPRDIGLRGGNPMVDDEAHPSRSLLLEGYYDLEHLRDLSVRFGQYKVPFSRQRVISSARMQFVDRSIVNGEFNHDRDIGLDVRSNDFLGLERLRYALGLYMGEGHSSSGLGDFGMLYIARVEYLPFGFFSDYVEADVAGTHAPRLSLGFAYAHLAEGKGARGVRGPAFEDGGTASSDTLTADLIFKWRGWSIQSEGFVRRGARAHGGAVDDAGALAPLEAPRDGLGWMVQSGYAFRSRRVELAGRYGEVRGQGDTSLDDAREAGAVINYYLAGHLLKLQADYMRLYAVKLSDGADQVRVQLQATF